MCVCVLTCASTPVLQSGDGAPVLRKGQMNSHQLDVKKLLHVCER